MYKFFCHLKITLTFLDDDCELKSLKIIVLFLAHKYLFEDFSKLFCHLKLL